MKITVTIMGRGDSDLPLVYRDFHIGANIQIGFLGHSPDREVELSSHV